MQNVFMDYNLGPDSGKFESRHFLWLLSLLLLLLLLLLNFLHVLYDLDSGRFLTKLLKRNRS